MINPASIARADLLRALESIGITDTASIARIVIGARVVEITRYVRSPTGGIMVDMLRNDAATEICRIEIV